MGLSQRKDIHVAQGNRLSQAEAGRRLDAL